MGRGGRDQEEYKDPFGSDGYVHYLGHGDGFMDVYMSKLKLYTLKM